MAKSSYLTYPQLAGTLTQPGPWQSLFARAGCRVYPFPLGAMSANSGTLSSIATRGVGQFAQADYVMACSAAYYGDTPCYIPDTGRISRVTSDPSVRVDDTLSISPSLTIYGDDWFCCLGADAAANPFLAPNFDGSRVQLFSDPTGDSPSPNPWLLTSRGGNFRGWCSPGTLAVDLLVTDGSGRPLLLVPSFALGPEIVAQ